MKSMDWMPSKRFDKLEMAKNWTRIIAVNGEAWSIPQPLIAALGNATNAADTANSISANERNTISYARIKAAFKELTAVMRDVKRRHFFVPPLTAANLAELGLKPKDDTPTNVPPPVARAEASIFFPAAAIVEINKIHPYGAHANEKAEYGVRIYYGIIGTPDETDRFRITQRPKTGADLPHSLFTRRKKHRFYFAGESGKEIFFCLRYENSKGEPGPWGSLISAYIP